MSDNINNAALIFQIALIGQLGVGKTRFVHQFADDAVYDFSLSEEFVGTTAVRTEIVKEKPVKLHIWDQVCLDSLEKAYRKYAQGFVLVYSTTDRGSLDVLLSWLEAPERSFREKYKIVVGNKSDMVNARQVSTEMGRELANRFQVPFFETSAIDGTNVDKVFYRMAADLTQKFGDPDLVPQTEYKMLAPSSLVVLNY